MLRALLVSIAVVLVLSCLTTPLVYSAILSVDPATRWPYSRVFDRVILFWSIMGIVKYRKELRLDALRPYFAADPLSGSAWRDVGIGTCLTLVTSLLALYLIVGDEMGRLRWHDQPFSYFFIKSLKVIPAAFIIALIEESFFRVLFLQKLKEKFPLWLAIALCSLLYGTVHFFSPDRSYQYPGWSPTIGFQYLMVLIDQLFSPGVLDGILGLTFAGVVLCLAIERTRSIFFCVGLHAGWIMGIKSAFFSTRINDGFSFPEGVGRRYFLVAEPAGWAAMGVVLILVLWFSRTITTKLPSRLVERD